MKKRTSLVNIILFSVLSVAFFSWCLTSPVGQALHSRTGSLNLPSMALCVVVFLALVILLGRLNLRLSPHLIRLAGIAAAAFLARSLFNEDQVFDAPGHLGVEFSSRVWLWLVLAAALVLCGCLLTRKARALDAPGRVGRALYIALTAVVAGLAAYNQYTPGVFSVGHNIYHFNAYTNSIWNVFWGQPYTATVTSVYGHYGFIYYPFLKLAWLLGARNLFKVYLAISAALVAAAVVMWAVVLASLVKRTSLRLLGVVGVGYVSCARITDIYPQLFPHRIFPIALIALMIALWTRAEKKALVRRIGWLVCVLLILWNTEFGLFCTVAWSALHCCDAIQDRGAKPWLRVVAYVAAIPVSFAAALLLCGALNKALGGEMLSVHEFIFPLASSGYMQGYLERPLASFPAAWMSIMAGLLGFMGMGLTDTALCARDCGKNPRTACCFALAVLGLGSVTYAVNRPAYGNFYVIMSLMAVIMAVFADDGMASWRGPSGFLAEKDAEAAMRSCLGIVSTGVLCAVAVSCVVNVPYKLEQQTELKDTSINRSIVEAIQTYGDGDEYAVGIGAETAFAMLGWDPKVYHMDIPDYTINPDAREDFGEKLNALYGKDLFYSFDSSTGPLAEVFSDAYAVADIMYIDSQAIYYCKPVKLNRRNRHE